MNTENIECVEKLKRQQNMSQKNVKKNENNNNK